MSQLQTGDRVQTGAEYSTLMGQTLRKKILNVLY